MWRSRFHIAPPYGLLNDPNGLIYWKGEYHLFYQWNPNACEHGAKHWAHLRSKDLILEMLKIMELEKAINA